MNEHRGGCHCGNLRWVLRSKLAALELPRRACQCNFCRKHNVISTSDPQGELRLVAKDRGAIIRYRFGTATAEFLMCAVCGIYAGAQMESDGHSYGIVNLRTLDGIDGAELNGDAMDYSGEDASARRSRRENRWTPVAAPL